MVVRWLHNNQVTSGTSEQQDTAKIQSYRHIE